MSATIRRIARKVSNLRCRGNTSGCGGVCIRKHTCRAGQRSVQSRHHGCARTGDDPGAGRTKLSGGDSASLGNRVCNQLRAIRHCRPAPLRGMVFVSPCFPISQYRRLCPPEVSQRGEDQRRAAYGVGCRGCRGRDTAFAVPPAQIRTGGFPAYGSYLR